MAITNIHKLQHSDRTPVQVSDIRVGAKFYFHSGAGLHALVCESVDDVQAVFKSADPTAPAWMGTTVEFNVPDLTTMDISKLPEMLAQYGNPRTKQYVISELYKADRLGYVSIASSTQAGLTPKGLEAVKEVKAKSITLTANAQTGLRVTRIPVSYEEAKRYDGFDRALTMISAVNESTSFSIGRDEHLDIATGRGTYQNYKKHGPSVLDYTVVRFHE